VGDVDDFGGGTDAENHAFHDTGVVVRGSEIGTQSNDGSGHRVTYQYRAAKLVLDKHFRREPFLF
jgi:hypothetical protein